jgi:hypothetical protein
MLDRVLARLQSAAALAGSPRSTSSTWRKLRESPALTSNTQARTETTRVTASKRNAGLRSAHGRI